MSRSKKSSTPCRGTGRQLDVTIYTIALGDASVLASLLFPGAAAG